MELSLNLEKVPIKEFVNKLQKDKIHFIQNVMKDKSGKHFDVYVNGKKIGKLKFFKDISLTELIKCDV